MKKVLSLLLVAAALAAPAAMASKGKGGGKGGATVVKTTTYQLAGTLSGYVAATASSAGPVTIDVTGGNKAARGLVGSTITFTLTKSTKIAPRGAAIPEGSTGS